MKNLQKFIEGLLDSRREAILNFHQEYYQNIYSQPGSTSKHQDRFGGLADHLCETMRIADVLYNSLSTIRPLPFSLDSAWIVLFFHDVEKIFDYEIDKDEWFCKKLPARGIVFSDEEINALRYVHGEVHDYHPFERRMGRLASFCHACDNLSARMWFDAGRGEGSDGV